MVLKQHKQLRPRTRVFTNSRGSSELLLCIHGKLNINSIDIPIILWVPSNYPIEHPLLLIDLELLDGYKISLGKFVDANGIVHLPIFKNWDFSSYNMITVIQEFIKTSAESLPIEKIQNLPPKIPKKTPITDEVPFAKLNINNHNNAIPVVVPIREVAAPPNIPTKPINLGQSKIYCEQINEHDTDRAPILPQKPPATPVIDLMDSNINDNNNQHSATHKEMMNELQKIVNELTVQDSNLVKNNFYARKASIESAIKQFESLHEYELTNISIISKAIKDTKSKIVNEMKTLEEQNKKIQEFESRNGTDIDPCSLVTTNSIALDQLYELVAKDQAISDTIHLLSQMLNRGSIPLELFVKKTRELARSQFLTRLHINKISLHLNN